MNILPSFLLRVAKRLNGMIAVKIAFSWTCHPNINELNAHKIIHLTKSSRCRCFCFFFNIKKITG
ncbi:GSCOCG00004890001-RA-CDS [Cotesia congregata]|nr:GSCOCG00004890001-RA-CDS [Cotesia congregata]